MTIKNEVLHFSAEEMEQMNTLAVMLSATGLTCAPWQNFGFAEDLCNAAITLSTITANAEKSGQGFCFDLKQEIYGSECGDAQGFAVDNVVAVHGRCDVTE